MALLVRTTAKKSQIITNCYLKYTNKDKNNFCLSTVFKQSSDYLQCQQIKTRNYQTRASKDNQTSKLPEIIPGDFGGENGLSTGTFDCSLAARRTEAAKTIIVEVQSANSCNDLYTYCRGFGNISIMHHYTVEKSDNDRNDRDHFFLVEFADQESHSALMNSATYINHREIIPVHSQMFSFRYMPGKKRNEKIKLDNTSNIHVPVVDRPTKAKVNAVLEKHGSDISKQMGILFDMWKLDDIGTRLRFFTTHQMENSFKSLFPNVRVLPFGSSVNGFGRKGCDLDLVINLETNLMQEKQSSRLAFRTKSISEDHREQSVKTLEVLSDVMKTFMPGIHHVRKILKARIPIIRYDHFLTGLECDLSMTNMTAVYMSELLFLFAESCDVVRPLVFTVRQWAASVNITGFGGPPGLSISNFQMTILVLFYLQQKKIIPTINTLKNMARPEDRRIAETCDCTFLRDINLFPKPENTSNETLESLLTGFFTYYANFDFSTKAISLRDGVCLYKPNTDNLYICNPLEKALNVSKNIHSSEVTRFIQAVRNAANLIDEGLGSDSRGLLDIFAEKQPRKKLYSVNKGSHLKVSELFDAKKDNNPTRRSLIRNSKLNAMVY